MTELQEAVNDRAEEAEERRLLRVAEALYVASQIHKVKQRDLIKQTGYSRETIRRHVEDERIRRGEIPPTKRYLEAQEKRAGRS